MGVGGFTGVLLIFVHVGLFGVWRCSHLCVLYNIKERWVLVGVYLY